MGWLSAMSLMQHMHRSLLIKATSCGLRLFVSEAEIRKDHWFPRPGVGDDGVLTSLWEVYCDDMDILQVVEDIEAATGAVCRADNSEPKELLAEHRAAREIYASHQVPTSVDKAGIREDSARRLGVQLDGRKGTIAVPPDKIRSLLSMICWALSRPTVTRSQMQKVMGHVVHASQLRRELSSIFNQVWDFISGKDWLGQRALPLPVKGELARFVSLLPCCRITLRSQPSPVATASDACETGGGVCA
jgi:hypothetical protein